VDESPVVLLPGIRDPLSGRRAGLGTAAPPVNMQEELEQ